MNWLTYPDDFPDLKGGFHEDDGSLVSIIVPVYNTPPDKLGRCVDSLSNQSYRNIEILIVDDGSEGDCAKYLNELPSKDFRIRILRGVHAGASAARNLGLSAARGGWVAFSDADDEYEPVFVKEALSIALLLDCDLVCGTVIELYVGEGKSIQSDSFPCYVGNPDDDEKRALASQMLGNAECKFFAGPSFQGRGPVCKLYRASLIKDLEFDEGISIGEDVLLNYRFIGRCQRIAIAQTCWYWYYQNYGSASHASGVAPWIEAIDGIVSACGEDEDIAPFVTFCSYLATRGATAIASASGVVAGREEAVRLLSHAGGKGCFDPLVFESLVISPGRKFMVWLCARGWYSAAYFYWILAHKLAGRERRKLHSEHSGMEEGL